MLVILDQTEYHTAYLGCTYIIGLGCGYGGLEVGGSVDAMPQGRRALISQYGGQHMIETAKRYAIFKKGNYINRGNLFFSE